MAGIEPTHTESKSAVLPLDYIPISKQVLTMTQRVELLVVGIEPTYLRDNRYPLMELMTEDDSATCSLLVNCSTN